MTPDEIAAFGYSLDNHSKMMTQFAFGFTSLFGILNSGSIVGLLAFAATDLGFKVISDSVGDFKFIAYLFGVGFLSASGLMVIIFFYSNKKYLHYRSVLKGKVDGNIPNEFQNLYAVGWVFCFTMLLSTFGGLNYTLELVTKSALQRKGDHKAASLKNHGFINGNHFVAKVTNTAIKT